MSEEKCPRFCFCRRPLLFFGHFLKKWRERLFLIQLTIKQKNLSNKAVTWVSSSTKPPLEIPQRARLSQSALVCSCVLVKRRQSPPKHCASVFQKKTFLAYALGRWFSFKLWIFSQTVLRDSKLRALPHLGWTWKSPGGKSKLDEQLRWEESGSGLWRWEANYMSQGAFWSDTSNHDAWNSVTYASKGREVRLKTENTFSLLNQFTLWVRFWWIRQPTVAPWFLHNCSNKAL